MRYHPGRLTWLAAFGVSTAWGQTFERVVPVALPAPVAYVGAVAPLQVSVSPVLSLALPSVAALPVSVAGPAVGAPGTLAVSIAAPVAENAALRGPVAAGPVGRLAIAADGPRSHSARLHEASPAYAELVGLASRSQATAGDRRQETARPAAAPSGQKAQPGGSGGEGPSYGGRTGRALLDAVSVDLTRNHRALGYDEARRKMFGEVDQVRRNGVRGILEAYSQTFVPGTSPQGGDYREPGDSNHDGWNDREGMNAEHIWPQSFFDKKAPMRSDLHNLMPTFVHPNSLRGHLPFGEVKGQPEYENDAGAKLGGGVFEPPDAIKGRVARSILYFVARYKDAAVRQGPYSEAFLNARLEMFLRWNRQFPPTAEEVTRNDRAARSQGNRNLFVDDPALADRIGVEGFRMLARGKSGRAADYQVPHFSPQALIETARMKPRHERGPRGFWPNPAADKRDRRHRR